MVFDAADGPAYGTKPCFSVIVPTFNRANLLQEALESVLSQEGAGDLFEMQVIVVDDASSDATPELMRRYPGVKYIRFDENQGASAARNAGIKASTGKYVALLDDDDLFLPHRLKSHLGLLESSPECGVAYSQLIVTGDGEDTLWPDARRAPSGRAFESILLEEFIIPACITIRRSAFEIAGAFDEQLRTMEHYDMFLRLSYHVPFAFIPGAVAIGRFSKQGKWFTNIKGGGYEKMVSFIIQRALALIPDDTYRRLLWQKAYCSWFRQITYWLERAEKFDRLRRHIVTGAAKEPWIVEEEWARPVLQEGMTKVACALARSAEKPIAAVKEFISEIEAETRGFAAHQRRLLRQISGEVWQSVGSSLAGHDSIRHRRAAVRAAAHSILKVPGLVTRPASAKLTVRSILAHRRWDPVIEALKRTS